MMLFPYAAHRHPDFWDDPQRFDPDRWLPEREAARHPYAYHPFAAGQRICINNNFSLFESQVLVARSPTPNRHGRHARLAQWLADEGDWPLAHS